MKKFLLRALLGIVSLIALWLIIHHTLLWIEKQRLKPPGKYITVNEKNMHVQVFGSGKHTIVLLPGLGTISPYADFENLAKELATQYQVVILEPLGYGYSDDTDVPRTSDNIVEEIRTALKMLDIQPPYVFMPHSMGGIYTLEYLSKYPPEVEALIGIDATVPHKDTLFEKNKTVMPELPESAMKFFRYVGMSRMMLLFSDEKKPFEKKLIYKNAFNQASRSETTLINDNIARTEDMIINTNIPILYFVSKDGEAQTPGWLEVHERITNRQVLGESILIEGGHSLHLDNPEKVVKLTQDFISKIPNKTDN